MRRTESSRETISSAGGTPASLAGDQLPPREYRQFILLLADCITAALYDPTGLGLDQRQSVRMAVSFLQEAQTLLGEAPGPGSPAGGNATAGDPTAELTAGELDRVTDMLTAMARQMQFSNARC